ncbi:hypothetical protein BJX64DRAFT_291302 [Aspergillus heterothallicus]
MRGPPPEVVASWPAPNYVDPDYQGPQLLIAGVILLAISCTVVGLRLSVRLYIKRSAGWDDWIILAAIPFMICSTVAANLGTRYGWGYHLWDNKPEWRRPSLMTTYFSQLCLAIIMALVKLSLLASYLRFFTLPLYRRLNWAMVLLVACWAASFLVAMLTACQPLYAYWDTEIAATAKCTDEPERTLAFTISNLITDVIILALPVPTLWRVKLPVRERLALIGLMSLGLLACAASAVRLYYAHRIYNVSYDTSWEGYTLSLWILVEINLSVICASIPTLRPLMKKYFPKWRSTGSSASAHGRGTSSRTAEGCPVVSSHSYSPKSPRLSRQITIQQTFYLTESTEALQSEGYQMDRCRKL